MAEQFPSCTRKAHKRAVRHAFDRAAPGYDAAAAVQREVCARLAALVRLHHRGQTVRHTLDAGCGTGFGQAHLAALFPESTQFALDFAPAMLHRLRAGLPAAGDTLAVCADLEHLPFATGSLDQIWSSLAVQWCDPALALAELGRCLSPGGEAWIATLGPRTLWELRTAFAAVDDDAHVLAFHPAETWTAASHAAGLTAVAVEHADAPALAPDLRSLLRDIKAIGAHTVGDARRRRPLGRHAWARLQSAYEHYRRADGQLPATYDLILLALRKPL